MAAYKSELLVVASHPDDAELFCGGLLLKARRAGQRTAVIEMSDAELSTFGSPEIRKQETAAATKMLELSFRESLELPNCWFNAHQGFEEGERESSPVMKLVRALRRCRAEVLVLPYWEARHPDHVAACQLAQRAVFLAGLEKVGGSAEVYRPRIVLFYPMRIQGPLSFLVDISDVREEKYKLIELYASQLHPREEGKTTLLASPLSFEALQARDTYLGSMIGRPAAEGYYTRNAVPINDPVAHFRGTAVSEACYFNL